MSTSPAPNAAAPPGMCPGVAVLGGAGGSGGSGGGAAGGGGNGGGGGGGNGQGTGGDGKSAPDPARYPDCGSASHPVDVVTGRAYTHPIVDLALPGSLPFVFERLYSSTVSDRDVGLGWGWVHSLGWEIEVRREHLRIVNDKGIAVDFPLVPEGGEVLGPWGWVVRREGDGFVVDAGDGVQRFFAPSAKARLFRLVRIEDANHNHISLVHEGDRLREVVDSVGRVIRFRPGPDGRIATIEAQNALAQGQWVRFAAYAYDEQGHLTSATDADGHSARYEYDSRHRLTADTDRTGLTFHFVYQADGRCVESWGDYPGKRDASLRDELPLQLADGQTKVKGIHHCRFDYMPNHYSEVADSTQVRRFFGNERGTLERTVEKGAVTNASYREDGHLMARVDPMGAVTRFERDARGRILKATDGLGRVTAAQRDTLGQVVRTTDPAGGVTVIERDGQGNILSVTDPMGGVTSYRNDARGLTTEEVSATGARTTYTSDAHGNLVAVTMPNGGVWRMAYDGLGRLLSRTDPLGAETRYTYSARGDLLGVRDALGSVTRYAYDGEGHLVEITDPNGRITALTWGGYHKLCARRDANGNEVRLRYNLEGELCEVYNELGEVHRLEYDIAGRLIGEVTFDGRDLRYRNDAAGRVVRAVNGLGEATDSTYDLGGQLIRRELPDRSVEAFTFNARGEMVGATSQAGEVLFERDALGRIVREVQRFGGKEAAEHWVEVVYDREGERTGRKTSLGHSEEVTRGVLGQRARTLLDGTHAVEHQTDALGREAARALPGGGWIQSSHDALGRVARRRAGGEAVRRSGGAGEPAWSGAQANGITVDAAYRYDANDELVEAWDRARGKTEYRYDPIGQLLAVVPEKARPELFRYDPAGNLFENGEVASEAAARAYGKGNRLLRKGRTEYRWDGDGRLVEKRERGGGGEREGAAEGERIWRYQWNGAGLLKAVELPDGRMVEFAYDPFARRMHKRVTRPGRALRARVPESATRFVWDGDVLVHEITARTQAHGDPVVEERTYCFEDDGFEPVAHRERAGWFHYVNDPIGTPERLVGANGAVACDLERTAWGETEAKPGARASTPIRFQGQYEDEETGLRYNRFRYYDQDSGRYVSADPKGLDAGLRAYGYATNPMVWVDPLGLDLWGATRLEDPKKQGGVLKGRRLTPDEAINRMGNSNDYDIYADSEKEARSLADAANKEAGRKCTPLVHSAHDPLGNKPRALPHVHPDGHDNPYHDSPHIFFPGPNGSQRRPFG